MSWELRPTLHTIATRTRQLALSGQGMILIAAVLWGTTGTAQAFAPEGATPVAVGTIRLAIGGLALLILAWQRGILHLTNWHPPATLMAALGVAAYQLCFFAAVDRTGVAVGTIVGIGSAPIMAGLLGWIGRGETVQQRWIIATGLAIAGCILLVLSGSEGVSVDPIGVLLALGAGASYACYTLFSKRLLDDHPPDAVMAVVFFLGAVLLSPLLVIVDLDWLAEPQGILVALHLSLITVVVAYRFFARGLLTVSVADTVTLTLAEPMTAGVLGVVVLREELPLTAWLGIALILIGLVYLALNRQDS